MTKEPCLHVEKGEESRGKILSLEGSSQGYNFEGGYGENGRHVRMPEQATDATDAESLHSRN